jgi:hypothetical protein
MLLKRKAPGVAPARVVPVYEFKGQRWIDPFPGKTDEEVRDLLAEQVPALTTCAITTQEEGTLSVRTFAEKTKGGKATATRNVKFTSDQGKRG